MNPQRNVCSLRSALLVIMLAIQLLVPGARAASKFKTLYSFTGGKDGATPFASLILDHAGNLYGTTIVGGVYNAGTVFELTPNADGSWTEKVLYVFTEGDDGRDPEASLIFDQAGNLYGTTSDGVVTQGTIFELTPQPDGSWREKTLHKFTGEDGAAPGGSLIFDQLGNLYGTTYYGGAGGNGVVFQLTPNPDGSWTESGLLSFCVLANCRDGSNPDSGLIFDRAGNLYGTTAHGGVNCSGFGGCGVVFQLTPSKQGSWAEKVIHNFMGGRDGVLPAAGVIFDKAGNLYGTVTDGGSYGHGIVFQLTQRSDGDWKEKVLYSFTGGKDGASPFASLILDHAGNLYGTTVHGGVNCAGFGGCGVVFQLAPTSKGGWNETVLHRFLDHPGAFPYSGLIFDSSRDLYGTTSGDGKTTLGSVFEITP